MNDKAYNLFLERMRDSGCSTLCVKDGRFFAFRRDKLEELLNKMLEANQDHGVIFIKETN